MEKLNFIVIQSMKDYFSVKIGFLCLLCMNLNASCQESAVSKAATRWDAPAQQDHQQSQYQAPLPSAGPEGKKLAQAAQNIINPSIHYDPSYFVLPYPGGDVPAGKGVCTDVVIRSFRKLGIDLQKEVHEDMESHFSAYPKIWGATTTDKNIDHRRVPNLMKYFERKGYGQSITSNGKDYLPGDVVAWRLSSGLTHIGIVSARLNPAKSNYQVVHNIGGGQVEEDVLFDYDIIGHYRLK